MHISTGGVKSDLHTVSNDMGQQAIYAFSRGFDTHFAGAFEDRLGEPCEAGDLDAVALVGAAGDDFAEKNNITGVPVTIIYDRNGKVHRNIMGYVEKEEIERPLVELLNK